MNRKFFDQGRCEVEDMSIEDDLRVERIPERKKKFDVESMLVPVEQIALPNLQLVEFFFWAGWDEEVPSKLGGGVRGLVELEEMDRQVARTPPADQRIRPRQLPAGRASRF